MSLGLNLPGSCSSSLRLFVTVHEYHCESDWARLVWVIAHATPCDSDIILIPKHSLGFNGTRHCFGVILMRPLETFAWSIASAPRHLGHAAIPTFVVRYYFYLVEPILIFVSTMFIYFIFTFVSIAHTSGAWDWKHLYGKRDGRFFNCTSLAVHRQGLFSMLNEPLHWHIEREGWAFLPCSQVYPIAHTDSHGLHPGIVTAGFASLLSGNYQTGCGAGRDESVYCSGPATDTPVKYHREMLSQSVFFYLVPF
ncbi:hypothetical protein BJX61DRAFT_368689 [Aspergillus egyptiacus]|nr:hypothetical protein BJX61DRAFT_368689 [Aspergillus egyptiacus]